MEPLPAGERFIPPARWTAVGAAMPERLRAVVDLRHEIESMAVCEYLRQQGWEVFLGTQEIVEVLASAAPILCVSDDREAIFFAQILGMEECVVVIVSDPSEEVVRDAYGEGADWVETRPLRMDPEQGLGRLARVR